MVLEQEQFMLIVMMFSDQTHLLEDSKIVVLEENMEYMV